MNGYSASINGIIMNGPNKEEFENIDKPEGKIAFAPDRFFLDDSVSNTEGRKITEVEDYNATGRLVSRLIKITYYDQKKTYDVKYYDFTYDDYGRQSSYSVQLQISSID